MLSRLASRVEASSNWWLLRLVLDHIALTDVHAAPRSGFVVAFCHVICLGNQRLVICCSDADRKYYLEPWEAVT